MVWDRPGTEGGKVVRVIVEIIVPDDAIKKINESGKRHDLGFGEYLECTLENWADETGWHFKVMNYGGAIT
jgi:hypothetical protein